ncbi:MAG TPA: UDP-3-O-(3-hydroxymyristoyl)glucosamine N-acyltransferase [Gammaproteobacteria bacterium]|nr:UDP-3-O-(3-hydroxymyristoyl)glucosamine N-acyltransferase [Gammaproteobacteria bacterium]
MIATLSLSKLAEITTSELRGNADLIITGISSLETAEKGEISFAIGRKYRSQLNACNASAVILTPDLAANYKGNVLINSSPYLAYAQVVDAFYPQQAVVASIHPSSVIDSSASVSNNACIGANVVIGKNVTIAKAVVIEAGSIINDNCSIGENTYLHANVTLYENTQIGQNTRIHSGAVIGSDGFGYAPDQNEWYKIKQIGNVIIGNQVEIGANTTIDRAALGSTQIADGVKLDNLIQIGHNVRIGEHTAIAACVAIAGSTTIGKRCQIGGASAIAGHLSIANDVIITGMSMVISSITSAGVYSSGMPVNKNIKWRRNIIRFAQLDKMAQKIRQLEKRIKL